MKNILKIIYIYIIISIFSGSIFSFERKDVSNDSIPNQLISHCNLSPNSTFVEDENDKKNWKTIIVKYALLFDKAENKKEVIQIYRKAVYEAHPDKNPNDEVNARYAFQQISNEKDRKIEILNAGFKNKADADQSGYEYEFARNFAKSNKPKFEKKLSYEQDLYFNQKSVDEAQINLTRMVYLENLKGEELYYGIIIEFVDLILKNYKYTFGGNKLLFAGPQLKSAWEVAQFLAPHYEIDLDNIIYVDMPSELYSDSYNFFKYLDQSGALQGDNISIFTHWFDNELILQSLFDIIQDKKGTMPTIYVLFDRILKNNFSYTVPGFGEPSKNKYDDAAINLSAIYLGKDSNWMNVEPRPEFLITYEISNGKSIPEYLSVDEIRIALEDCKLEETHDLRMFQNTRYDFTSAQKKILIKVFKFCMLNGYNTTMQPNPAISKLREMMINNSSSIVAEKDVILATLLHKKMNKLRPALGYTPNAASTSS